MPRDFVDRYCDLVLDYPGDHIAAGGFRLGCWYNYVSSTFIQGFVNYPTIVEARLLDRYTIGDPGREDRNDNDTENFLIGLGEFGPNGRHHTNVGELFDDDVILLARAKQTDGYHAVLSNPENSPVWWVFWFDRDVSDCRIACFETNDAPEQVHGGFQEFVDSLNYPNRKLPTEGFRGWITF